MIAAMTSRSECDFESVATCSAYVRSSEEKSLRVHHNNRSLAAFGHSLRSLSKATKLGACVRATSVCVCVCSVRINLSLLPRVLA